MQHKKDVKTHYKEQHRICSTASTNKRTHCNSNKNNTVMTILYLLFPALRRVMAVGMNDFKWVCLNLGEFEGWNWPSSPSTDSLLCWIPVILLLVFNILTRVSLNLIFRFYVGFVRVSSRTCQQESCRVSVGRKVVVDLSCKPFQYYIQN